MGNREILNYDAFISYRHSELDSFVAETVHRELEKFKLPANLIKERGEGAKTKINRVFRDKEELPIASDLSENISIALDHSDYLIVICSPRLKESIWCKNEIDTFVAKNGTNKVLAVLAEGEPSESFPEQLTQGVEPLAADVRGATKAEIRKKIKEEVMRLSAAMFECNYDEIRQRHKEQMMKKRVTIASIIAAVGIIFAAVVSVLALQISDQKVQISEQLQKIESQYKDTLIKQSTIVVSQAENYLNDGDVESAKNLIIDTYNEASGQIPDEALDNYKYILAETLGCYTDGSNLRPVANLPMEYAIKIVTVSPDYKYVAAFDEANNLAVFDLDTYEKIYEASTDFDSNDENVQNYGFDSDDNFYYLGDGTFARINLSEGTLDYSTNINHGKRFTSIDENRIFVAGGNTIYVISKADGSILKQSTIENRSEYENVGKITMSSDRKRILMAGSSKDGNMLLNIDADSLEILDSVNLGDSTANMGVNTGEALILMVMEKTGSEHLDYTYYLTSIDEKTLDINWKKEVNYLYSQMYVWNNSILAIYSGGIELLDISDCSVKESSQVDRRISDLVVTPDGILRLFLTDASHKIQNTDEFSFYEDTRYIVGFDHVLAYKYAGYKYIFLPMHSDKLCIYEKQLSSEAIEVSVSEDNRNQTELCSLEYDNAYTNNELGVSVKLNPDNSADIISLKDNEARLKVQLEENGKVRSVSSKYIAVGDYKKSYIINLETLTVEAKVYGYLGYDEATNMFTIAKSITNEEGYQIPFYSMDELMNLAK